MTRVPAGLRAIILYKTIKAIVQLGLGLVLAVLWPFGLPSWLHGLSSELRRQFTQGWASHLAAVLAAGSTHRRIAFVILALSLDGALTAIEAWALRRGRWWGPWLVVAATASLLPVEVYEFFRVPRVSRALLFAVNLLMAAYLARRAWREHLERKERLRAEHTGR
jgi:uncharacterized membrane protein (DUF2068 family)